MRGVQPSRLAILVSVAVLPVTVVLGHDVMTAGTKLLYEWSPVVRAELTALDEIKGRVKIDPDAWHVDPLRAPDITAARYYNAAYSYGRAGESVEKLRAEPADARGAFDAAVLHGTGTVPIPSAGPPASHGPVSLHAQQGATVSAKDGCLFARSNGNPDAAVEVDVPQGGVHFRASAPLSHVGLRFWANDPIDLGSVPANAWYSVAPPAVDMPGNWAARFDLSRVRQFVVCGP